MRRSSEIDVLPTLVKLAGGSVPTDRKIDGKDIWPLLAGQTRESPHDALFYFNGNQLQAVRSGFVETRHHPARHRLAERRRPAGQAHRPAPLQS